jgi:hypothetical protein
MPLLDDEGTVWAYPNHLSKSTRRSVLFVGIV